MIDSRDEMFLWVEKYRPQKIDDCVLPQALKDTFRQYVEQGELPNFLFTGSAGVGKTTIAKALCNEIGAEYMMINGSEESGIDTLRTKIKGFASTISLTDAKKLSSSMKQITLMLIRLSQHFVDSLKSLPITVDLF